jgi:hypothetical protein
MVMILVDEETINYSVEVYAYNGNLSLPHEASGKAFERVNLPLGNCTTAGDYKLSR